MVRKFWLPSKKYQMQTGELLRESSEPADFKGASADSVGKPSTEDVRSTTLNEEVSIAPRDRGR